MTSRSKARETNCRGKGKGRKRPRKASIIPITFKDCAAKYLQLQKPLLSRKEYERQTSILDVHLKPSFSGELATLSPRVRRKIYRKPQRESIGSDGSEGSRSPETHAPLCSGTRFPSLQPCLTRQIAETARWSPTLFAAGGNAEGLEPLPAGNSINCPACRINGDAPGGTLHLAVG